MMIKTVLEMSLSLCLCSSESRPESKEHHHQPNITDFSSCSVFYRHCNKHVKHSLSAQPLQWYIKSSQLKGPGLTTSRHLDAGKTFQMSKRKSFPDCQNVTARVSFPLLYRSNNQLNEAGTEWMTRVWRKTSCCSNPPTLPRCHPRIHPRHQDTKLTLMTHNRSSRLPLVWIHCVASIFGRPFVLFLSQPVTGFALRTSLFCDAK